jgi:hypothetical protein
MLTSTSQLKLDGLKRQEESVKFEIDGTLLESTFLNRAECISFVKLKFGFEKNKNINFNIEGRQSYRSSKSLFMRCEDCENFKIVGRLHRGKFIFVIEECCISHGNKDNLPCVSTSKATSVYFFVFFCFN